MISTTATSGPLSGCIPTVTAPTFTGTDNCEGTIIPIVTTAGATNTGCAYTQTWTANFTDACGNAATPVTITYTWTQDTQLPVISTTAVSGPLTGCSPTVTAPTFTGLDNCDGVFNPIVTTGGPSNTGCDYSQTWTANYTDACGNAAAPVSITYTWTQDTQAPVISTTATSGPLTGCNPTVTAPTFTGTDNCEGTITPVVTTAGPTNTGCAYTQTWTANFTDACGNAATPVSITYTWTQDTQAPVITTTATSGPLSGCNPTVTAPTFTGTDNCEGTITPIVTTAGAINTGCAYTQTWTANYTDACGNAAAPVSITYTWTQDTQAPVISTTAVSGPLSGCNPTVTAPTFTGTDNCEGTITPLVTTAGPTNTGCAYTQTWTANYTDACGNAAAPVTITYTWTQDTNPVITCPSSPQERTLEPYFRTYTTAGNEFDNTSLSDDCGTATVTNNLNGLTTLAGYVFNLGVTTVIWTAIDACGNSATCSFDVIINSPNIELVKTGTFVDIAPLGVILMLEII